MPSADSVRRRALDLARADVPNDEAVQDLFTFSEERRVSVVLARQELLKEAEPASPSGEAGRAAELLDQVLNRLPLA
jgi:hypothetical protein